MRLILQLVVPEKLRQRVLSMAHDTLLGGHRRVAKTQDRVTSEFYWPGIHDDVAINPELSAEQINEVKSLLKEYSDIFTDVPKITHLVKHRVDLTQRTSTKQNISNSIQDGGSNKQRD